MMQPLLNNRYRILKTLGRGGFGETFLAVDTHMPSGKKCVIKQLKPAIEAPEIPQWMQERFQREAAILEQLGEENNQIPKLYAYFSESGNFYLVQEWIEGVTLTQRVVQTGNLSEEEVTKILVNLLPVLNYIHNRSIVHRDVKPDNIILRKTDGLPVLIDFGAVKEAMTTVVKPGNAPWSQAIGTPGYMPSEQAAGRPLYSSDLYSLGLTAVFLLTGKSPQELITNQETGEILWRKAAPNMHSHLATVIDKAVRFHPRDRLTNAQEMLAALQHSPRVEQKIPTPPPQQPQPVTGKTVAVAPLHVEEENEWVKLIILPVLFIGGLGVLSFVIGFSLFFPKQETPPVIVEQPETTFPPVEIPETPAEAEETPVEEETPAEEEETPAAEEETPVIEIPVETEEETPETNLQPSPQPAPVEEKAAKVFPVGANGEEILQVLGEPKSKSKGYRQDTTAWRYEYSKPEPINIRYELDTNTWEVRQIEVYFDNSIDLKVIEKTLNKILGGNTPEYIELALRRIYEREEDMRSFEKDNLEGWIRRERDKKISIIAWEKGFLPQ